MYNTGLPALSVHKCARQRGFHCEFHKTIHETNLKLLIDVLVMKSVREEVSL